MPVGNLLSSSAASFLEVTLSELYFSTSLVSSGSTLLMLTDLLESVMAGADSGYFRPDVKNYISSCWEQRRLA